MESLKEEKHNLKKKLEILANYKTITETEKRLIGIIIEVVGLL